MFFTQPRQAFFYFLFVLATIYVLFSMIFLLLTVLVHQVCASSRTDGCLNRDMGLFEVSFQPFSFFFDVFYHFLSSEVSLKCSVRIMGDFFFTDLPGSSVRRLLRCSPSRVATASRWSCFFCVSLIFFQAFLLLEFSRVREASSVARPGCFCSSCPLLANGE